MNKPTPMYFVKKPYEVRLQEEIELRKSIKADAALAKERNRLKREAMTPEDLRLEALADAAHEANYQSEMKRYAKLKIKRDKENARLDRRLAHPDAYAFGTILWRFIKFLIIWVSVTALIVGAGWYLGYVYYQITAAAWIYIYAYYKYLCFMNPRFVYDIGR